ncbi:hypothetical protein SAMN05216282_10199 [Cryobacterium psychrotolerans]|uniref:Uncharacterized protein n=1 Tax=Cryobacterium psychrotolerans TaxID=386301 RepID=A0A1G8X5N1_9MICO|nr:hypothetical protein [Cryobacterium psychrotolerans]TFD83020.1 hypothetical protein E3T56_14920 [Cryobacterium psychrotolerans]SDJ85922.1 hypothetical protein SAMN05216282_10199 [Cryobacterium psychrotolerans]
MARIRSMKHSISSGRIHPTDTDAEWTVVTSPTGDKYLQITTFGSDSRVSDPKPSQTIQINAEIAGELQRILAATFGIPS